MYSSPKMRLIDEQLLWPTYMIPFCFVDLFQLCKVFNVPFSLVPPQLGVQRRH